MHATSARSNCLRKTTCSCRLLCCQRPPSPAHCLQPSFGRLKPRRSSLRFAPHMHHPLCLLLLPAACCLLLLLWLSRHSPFLSGDAILNVRKAKLIPSYELCIKVKWEGKTAGGDAGSGLIELPYVADENHDEDPEIRSAHLAVHVMSTSTSTSISREGCACACAGERVCVR